MKSQSSANAIDGIASIMFVTILAIALPAYPGGWIFVVGAAIFYSFHMILLPLWQSKPLKSLEVVQAINNKRVALRVSNSQPTRALDLGFRKYIILNRSDLEGPKPTWRLLVPHEYAHIKNGDSLFFHFAGISALSSAIFFFQTALLFVSFFFLPDSRRQTFAPGTEWLATLAIPAFFTVTAFFLLWIRQSLHSREHIADSAGHAAEPKAYETWLKRRHRRERSVERNWRSIAARAVKWFTHPSFEKRHSVITSVGGDTKFRLVPETLRSLGFLYGASFLAYAVWMAAGSLQYLGSLWVLYAYMALTVLTVSAGFAAISVSVMAALSKAGFRVPVLFCLALVAINYGFLASWYWFTVAASFFDTLTADLPQVPAENRSGGIFTFLAILGSFGAIMLALNVLWKRLFPRRSYNVVIHLLIGFCSGVGAFLVPKALYAAFLS